MRNNFLVIILCTYLMACTSSNNALIKETTYSPSGVPSTNIRMEGSLVSTNDLGCIATTNLSNHYTPADIYTAAAQCIREDNLPQASLLFWTAGAYGAYDGLRIKDPSAGQARQALILKHITPLTLQIPEEKKKALQHYLAQRKVPNSQLSNELCANLHHLGPPDYYPRYMINHGLDAMMEKLQPEVGHKQDALVANFNGQEAWNKVINQIHCSSTPLN